MFDQVSNNKVNVIFFLKGVLGGNLGLFLGASMITVIELIVLFFTCCISIRRFFRKAGDCQLNKIIWILKQFKFFFFSFAWSV